MDKYRYHVQHARARLSYIATERGYAPALDVLELHAGEPGSLGQRWANAARMMKNYGLPTVQARALAGRESSQAFRRESVPSGAPSFPLKELIWTGSVVVTILATLFLMRKPNGEKI